MVRANADFDASLRAGPVGNPCLIDRGHVYLSTGQPDLAIEDFEEAARFFKTGPKSVEATAGLIVAIDAAGQGPRAAALLERAGADNPEIAAQAWNLKARNKARIGNLDGIPGIDEYFANYGVSHESLKVARPDAIVMHPGPMNRGIEIEGSLADGPRSMITRQVTNGVAVRMAVLDRVGKTMAAR